MVNIHGPDQGQVDFYGSRDLTQWSFLSTLSEAQALPGKWECPDMFPLPCDGVEKWILSVNTSRSGVFSSHYIIGQFDGMRFVNDHPGRAIKRETLNLYADMVYEGDPQGRRILLGWIRQDASPKRCWTGMQSLPQELSLRRTADGVRLCARPAAEIRALRGKPVVDGKDIREMDLPPPGDGALELELDMSSDAASELELSWAADGETRATLDWTQEKEQLRLELPEGRCTASLPARNRRLHLNIFFDRAVISIFGAEGELAAAVPWDHNIAGTDLRIRCPAREGHLRVWHL